MVNYLHDISRNDKAPDIVNVVIEIPMGSRNKYELDRETGLLRLDRVVHSPFHYPTDYGFIPQTWERDNDPLDALVLTNHPVVPLCVVEARPIGLLKMKDEKGIDHKILCVPCGDPRFAKVMDMRQLPPHWPKEIGHFFERYKELEEGKYSEILGWFGAREAKECVKRAMERYDEKFKC